ncbi:MAG: hypothetical protein TYPL_0740 [Candidatus Tyloplasma litorale]|nr:MAG: hypothetical protein TYPL_0740 [Mycoplasmatales bacterium]
MKDYFKTLIETFKTLEYYKKDFDLIADLLTKKIHDRKGRIILISSGPMINMIQYMVNSFDYLFKIDNKKFLIIEPGKKYINFYEKNWKKIENDKSIGAFDAKEFLVNKNDLVLAFSVTGKTNYINNFLKQAHQCNAKTIMIKSSSFIDNINFVDIKINIELAKKSIEGLYIGNHTTILKMVFEYIIFKMFENLGQIFEEKILTTKIWTKKMMINSLEVLRSFNPNMSDKELENLIVKAENELSIAIVMSKLNVNIDKAKIILQKNKYNFKNIL